MTKDESLEQPEQIQPSAYSNTHQPEQEPDKYLMEIECTKCGAKESGVLTFNTAPPQRKPLTDEEITQVFGVGYVAKEFVEFVRAIEAAHGIKE